MCGLGGYVGSGSERVLDAMTKLLVHRGPDAQGTWVGHGVGLAATRLAILDLSPAGNQPMGDASSGVYVAFNGEIYNFETLRTELMSNGHAFHSRSDTEVLLRGYRQWEDSILARLRGMFAFAIWDEPRRQLFLARDRLGIKPLFYAQVPNGLVFASEIKALFAHPSLAVQLDPAAVDDYLALGYVPSPRTIFRGVHALPPAHWLRWRAGGLETGRYWRPDFREPVLRGREDDLVDELDARLNDAVRSHLLADVPVGVFLSGGIDSSLVAAIAQRHSAEPLHTFTIGFDHGGDERAYARQVSAHIGSRHHERLAEPALEAELARLVWHLEQPLFDNSVLPTHLVSQLGRDAEDGLRGLLREAPVRDPREALLHADLLGFLPEDILFKVDRMSMAHSLEVRVPLLDHHLLEWVLRLPWAMRFQRGRGKHLLRRVAARYLPASIVKPRKQGFTVPVGRWLHGALGDLARALFASEAFAARGIVRQDRALQLLAMHRSGRFDLGHRIWSLVVLETWCRVWLDGQSHTQSLRAMVEASASG